ncbi:MAG: UDP-N-acetylmuramoyl-tripeptide--D-alanyl-D-alanine ligase, partial [Woeseiaceae bacterium]
RLFVTGALSRNTADAFGERAQWFENVDELVRELKRNLSPDVTVLVKGSRSTHMERVVHALQDDSVQGRGA